MSCRNVFGKGAKNGSHTGMQEFSTMGKPPPCPSGGSDKWNLNYCTLSGWSWTKKEHPVQQPEHPMECRRSRKSNLRDVLMCCIPGADAEVSTAPSECACVCERRFKPAVSSPSSCDNIRCPYRNKSQKPERGKTHVVSSPSSCENLKRSQHNKKDLKSPNKDCCKCDLKKDSNVKKKGFSKCSKKDVKPELLTCSCPKMPPVIYYHCCHCCDKNNCCENSKEPPKKKQLEHKTTNTSPLVQSIASPPPQRTPPISRDRCDCKLLQSMAEAIFNNESSKDRTYDIYNLETPITPLPKNFHYPKINRPSRIFAPKPFGYNPTSRKRSTLAHKLPESSPSTTEDNSDIDRQLHNLLKSIKIDSSQFLDNPMARFDDPFL